MTDKPMTGVVTSTEDPTEKGSVDKKARTNKGNRGRGFRGRFRKDRGYSGKPGNDFSFWNEYPELMNIATRFPWMHIAGTNLQGSHINVLLPNVAVQHFIPVPGYQDNATSPLNLAFRQLYLDMHRKYRGIGTYQASDIAITVLCIESALQMIAECERIYGILNAYPIKSRILPEGILKAMGYSAAFIANVAANRADFRYGINRLIRMAQRLPLPKGMNFFANHLSLNSFVYSDSKDDRADLLVFICDSFFKYEDGTTSFSVNSAGTAYLEPFVRSNFAVYSTLIDYVENRLQILLRDSDILRITSDFIACYGESNMQTLTELPEDYVVVPAYSPTILSKWHNSERHCLRGAGGTYASIFYYLGHSSSTTPCPVGTPFFAVYQEGDVIYSMLSQLSDPGSLSSNRQWVDFSSGHPGYGIACTTCTITYDNEDYHVADTWESEPSQETICEAMLWKPDMFILRGNTSGTTYLTLMKNISTEYLTEVKLFAISGGNANPTGYSGYSTVGWDGSDRTIEHFDWAPYNYSVTTSNRVATLFSVWGDTDNITVVTSDVIAKIIDAALLSAFKVSTVGGNQSVKE